MKLQHSVPDCGKIWTPKVEEPTRCPGCWRTIHLKRDIAWKRITVL